VHLTTRQTEEAPRSLQMCRRTSLKNEGWETEQMPRLVERECADRVRAHIGTVLRFFQHRSNGCLRLPTAVRIPHRPKDCYTCDRDRSR
jgi:hypothetical protein